METTKSVQERIRELALELALEQQPQMEEMSDEFGSPFEAVEVRAAAIGDLLMRELTEQQIRLRMERSADDQAVCPECGEKGRPKRARSRTLQTIRGEIKVSEPEQHCTRCRRSFFPGDLLAGSRTGQRPLAAPDAKSDARRRRGAQL
jgi:hypothetical protein